MSAMRWGLFFIVFSGGCLWLLARICERAPFYDEPKRGPELETWELDELSDSELHRADAFGSQPEKS